LATKHYCRLHRMRATKIAVWILGCLGLALLLAGTAVLTQPNGPGTESALVVLPALLLGLRGPWVGGHDLPPYLTTAGVIAVYVVPGALLVVLAFYLDYGARERVSTAVGAIDTQIRRASALAATSIAICFA